MKREDYMGIEEGVVRMYMYNTANAFDNDEEIDRMNEAILEKVDMNRKKEMMPSISCIGFAGEMIGFRQCAAIGKIAEETGSSISLTANGQSAKADSILGLLKMHISAGTFVVLTVKHGDLQEAFRRCREVLKFMDK